MASAERSGGRIYRRGSRWYVDIWLEGQRVRPAAGTRRADAEALRAVLAEEAASAPRSKPLSLHDAMRAYIVGLRARGKSSSVRQAEVHAETLRRHVGAGFDVRELTVDHVDAFATARLAEGVSRASVNGSLRYLRAALRRAVEAGRLESATRVRLLRETRRVPRVLCESEVRLLLDHANEPFDLTLLLAAKAGLRHQEIRHLQWRDVDLDREIVAVSAKPAGPALPLGWTPKAHTERAVPMAPSLRARIADFAAGDCHSRTDWLFPGREGCPRRSVAPPVREIFKSTGLYDPDAKLGLHQLRRTWASMVARTGDLPALMRLAGWADLAAAQRYLGTTDERMREALAGIA